MIHRLATLEKRKMNSRNSAVRLTLIRPAGLRWLPVLLLTFVMSGCAAQTNGIQPLEIMSRDSNTVSHGNVSNAFPRTTRIVIDIDRRIYLGNSEPTAPNETFGFALTYGQNRYAAVSAGRLERSNFYKAILSSSDNHVLRCDIAKEEGKQRDGICVDDFGRIYDMVSTR
jgi:hypothetical protein